MRASTNYTVNFTPAEIRKFIQDFHEARQQAIAYAKAYPASVTASMRRNIDRMNALADRAFLIDVTPKNA